MQKIGEKQNFFCRKNRKIENNINRAFYMQKNLEAIFTSVTLLSHNDAIIIVLTPVPCAINHKTHSDVQFPSWKRKYFLSFPQPFYSDTYLRTR